MKRLLTLVAGTAALLGATLWSAESTAPASGAACGAACKATTAPATTGVQAATISPAGLDALVKAGTAVAIFDARSGTYDDGRRVPGAKSLTDKATAEEVAKLVPAKSALIVTYCVNPKCPASPMLAKHLRELGYTNVIEMPAGIEGWVAEGHAVETVK
jgi:rhodanese-related sulfurtransferase